MHKSARAAREFVKRAIEELKREDIPDISNYNRKEFEIRGTVLKRYKGESVHVVIPKGVTKIDEKAFEDNYITTSIIIPDGVRSIGFMAFCLCNELKDVYIPPSVRVIDNAAFDSCGSLEAVIVPEGVKRIGRCAFSVCRKLKYIYIPSTATCVEENAVGTCPKLEEIELGKNNPAYILQDDLLVEIATSVVIGAQNASKSKIKIPDNITAIGDSVFDGREKLTSVDIPFGVKRIASMAFGGCSGLTEIGIPSSVETIEDAAFEDCTNLAAVHLPNGLSYIGDEVFENCTALTCLYVPESVEYIGMDAFFNSGLKYIELPENMCDDESFAIPADAEIVYY